MARSSAPNLPGLRSRLFELFFKVADLLLKAGGHGVDVGSKHRFQHVAPEGADDALPVLGRGPVAGQDILSRPWVGVYVSRQALGPVAGVLRVQKIREAGSQIVRRLSHEEISRLGH
jgi:hypothetical protein